MSTRAYTLIELLVAMAIVVVLAALLMPVFSSAKEEARKASCTANFKQVLFASTLYQVDYDDRYVLSKYTGDPLANAYNDRTWVQLTYPYMRTFSPTKCPSDTSERPGLDPVFDADLVVGPSVERYYTVSTRANTGFNFVYLSPVVKESGGKWIALPRSVTEMADPAKTLVLGDSTWDVTALGEGIGGGSYLIVPPCRYVSPNREDSFRLYGYNNDRIYTAAKVWDDAQAPQQARLGGLFARHSGRLTAAMADGSVRALTISQIAGGCTVRQRWGGLITDTERYLWDFR